MNSKIIAIIPARKGSKRLPNKNKLLLNGKPLISYTMEAAIASKYIDDLIISSDDNDIKTIVNNFRNRIYSPICRIRFDRRPKHLRGDLITTQEIIDNIRIRYPCDSVCLLQPTSPLRSTLYIDKCIEMHLTGYFDSVITVKETTPYTYYPNGAVYVFKDKIYTKNMGLVVMPENESIDIDTQEDFNAAKTILGE
jgi:CMP-N-acetylneuraminic acid synthetase